MRAPTGPDEWRRLGDRQAELAEELARLESASAELADTWTGVRYDGPDLVVLTTDPRRDRPRLLALVEHRDRVRVEQSRFTRAHLDEVYEQVQAVLVDGRWHSHGPGMETVTVHLRSTEGDLAGHLHQRFGDAIEIRLGGAAFPSRFPPAVPRPAPASSIEVAGLVLTAEPDRRQWVPGTGIHGRVRLRNEGDGRLRLGVGAPAIGALLGPDGTVVGRFNGAIAGVERGFSLDPGEEGLLGFIAGSDAVDPTDGATLPPGEYALVVGMHVTVGGELGPHGRLVTPPAAITLEENTDTSSVGDA